MFDREFIWQQLKTIEDPDVHVNIVDLGLIYDVENEINESENKVKIIMTLTSPACPMAGFLMDSVKNLVSNICVESVVDVELVWDPAWHTGMITELGKMELGLL